MTRDLITSSYLCCCCLNNDEMAIGKRRKGAENPWTRWVHFHLEPIYGNIKCHSERATPLTFQVVGWAKMHSSLRKPHARDAHACLRMCVEYYNDRDAVHTAYMHFNPYPILLTIRCVHFDAFLVFPLPSWVPGELLDGWAKAMHTQDVLSGWRPTRNIGIARSGISLWASGYDFPSRAVVWGGSLVFQA